MTFENIDYIDNNTIEATVSKRNIERQLLPNDALTLDGVTYIVDSMRRAGKLIVVTLKVKHRHTLTLRKFIIKHRPLTKIQIINSLTFSQSNIIAWAEDYFKRYDNLLEKEVKRYEQHDDVLRVMLYDKV